MMPRAHVNFYLNCCMFTFKKGNFLDVAVKHFPKQPSTEETGYSRRLKRIDK